jgi:hypothetical protein
MRIAPITAVRDRACGLHFGTGNAPLSVARLVFFDGQSTKIVRVTLSPAALNT